MKTGYTVGIGGILNLAVDALFEVTFFRKAIVWAITKLSYWLYFALLLMSCQASLTQTGKEVQTSSSMEVEISSVLVPADKIFEKSLVVEALDSLQAVTLKQVYVENKFQSKWLGKSAPLPIGIELIKQLQDAANYGLYPEVYQGDSWEKQMVSFYSGETTGEDALVDLDINLTTTFLQFCDHLMNGREIEPGEGRFVWIKAKTRQTIDGASIAALHDQQDLVRLIEDIQPKHEQYARLKKALSFYRSLEEQIEPIEIKGSIHPQANDASIPEIRKRVSALLRDGLYDENAPTDTSTFFDDQLSVAISRLQKDYGVKTTGMLDKKTMCIINRSIKDRMDLIALNMDRLRWAPSTFGSHYIAVNIPDYRLTVVKKNKKSLEMNVIVGAKSTPTPIFNDTLEYMVLSPTWTVPYGIMKHEVLPALKRDSAHYSATSFKFYKNGKAFDPTAQRWDDVNSMDGITLVQQPGSGNALGLAKFIMPNSMNVYLHDTPDHKPFNNSYRALSHGCIRLSEPAQLAEYLLSEMPEWNSESIRATMSAGVAERIDLQESIPVFLMYQTCWVDDEGHVQFRDDIYGHDARQLKRLQQSISVSTREIML